MESKITSVISSKFEYLPIKSSLRTWKYRCGYVNWQLPEWGEPRGRGVSSPLAIFFTSYVWIETKSSIFFFSSEISWRFFLFNFPCFINYYIHPSLISFLFQTPSCWISSRNKVIWIFVSFVGLIELVCDETSF